MSGVLVWNLCVVQPEEGRITCHVYFDGIMGVHDWMNG